MKKLYEAKVNGETLFRFSAISQDNALLRTILYYLPDTPLGDITVTEYVPGPFHTAEVKNPNSLAYGKRVSVCEHPTLAGAWLTRDGLLYFRWELVFLPAEDYDPDTVAEISRYYADKEFNGD